MFSDEQNDSTRGQLAISSQNRNAACAFPMANWPRKRVLVFFSRAPSWRCLLWGFTVVYRQRHKRPRKIRHPVRLSNWWRESTSRGAEM